MADFITNEGKETSQKFIRVDMTPMVDLGFLLITFFMFTTNFSKPNILDLGLPQKAETPMPVQIDFKNQLTFVIDENDQIYYYQQDIKRLKATDIKRTTLEGLTISHLIKDFKSKAPKPEIFTVIIKPTENSNYKNFVDMLDNLSINQNERYGISELNPVEKTIFDAVKH